MDHKNQDLIVSSSPHVYDDSSVKGIMRAVFIALVPATIVGVCKFGINALIVILVSIASCVVFEAIFQKLMGKKITIGDYSAAVTGLLLAMNLPSTSPVWLVIIGSFVAMYIGKHIFGGLGQNPFNPALVSRVFLLISFPLYMTSWQVPSGKFFSFDITTQATPLSILQTDGVQAAYQSVSNLDLFLGNVGGSIGELSALALLIGGIYLMLKKIISWEIPVTFIGSVYILTGIFNLMDPDKYIDPVFHILSGGLFLGAFFMATDYVTSPLSRSGKILFGIMCGLITVIIRVFGGYPEGVSFAILFMNGTVPLIDKYMHPKRFGRRIYENG